MKRTFKTLLSDRRGLALITVIGTLALATILLMAIFSVTQTEYKATQSFAAAQSAKQLADAANAIVQAQIQNGQNTLVGIARTTHATQPGCVRVYRNDGGFLAGYKLYSSSQMVMRTATAIAERNLGEGKDAAGTILLPVDWDTAANSARFVDLNEPVVRPPLVAGPGVTPSIYFPIIDPRAAYNFLGSQTPAVGVPTTQVEGFSYSNLNPAGAVVVNGVVRPTVSGPGEDIKLRLPMPVEWIYMLQDGTMGTLDASNKFISATPGVTATVNNPMVGRLAFWTDDESCKINVNTAAEPTFAGNPYYFHDRDRKWAHFPALSSEYQRYQGHPATVALSTVLAPNYLLDPANPTADGLTLQNIIDVKESIYDLAPKIEKGGSMAGTKTYVRDDFDSVGIEAVGINTATSRAERLYASVDEMLFKDGVYNVGTGRSASQFDFPGAPGRVLFDHDTLERSRFFLTAHSRAPEFSIHGLPRIAVWPVADEVAGADKRSNFDNLIALCATLNNTGTGGTVPNSYIFRRSQAHHPTYDVTGTTAGFPGSTGLQRNRKLLEYLETQMTQLSFPKTSGAPPAFAGVRSNFQQKYGLNNVRQLGVEIFDYIRCINLYDGMLARSNNGAVAAGLTSTALYNKTDTTPFKTFTNPRITTQATTVNRLKAADAGVMPGHGQVTPAVWDQGGINYRGFGRMFTLSEVGLQVICTADGKNDTFAVGAAGEFGGVLSGGMTGARISEAPNTGYGQTNSTVYPGFNLPNGPNSARWYSNFPPLTGNPPPVLYGVNYSPANGPRHPSKHLGYNPEVWNYTLQANTPLATDEKRIQAMIALEAFCPMLGWTKLYPEFTIEIDGNFIAGIRINGQTLFNTTGSLYLKSNGNAYEVSNVYSVGGHSPPSALYDGRRCAAPGGPGVLMPSDPGFDSSIATKHSGLGNFSLTSQFVTIKRDDPMNMTFPNRPFVIKIWDTHDYLNPQKKVIQTINIQLPVAFTAPTPLLGGIDDGTTIGNPAKFTFNFKQSVNPSGQSIYTRSRQAPHWWCFNWGGCVGRAAGKVNPLYKVGGGPGPGPGGGAEPFWKPAPSFADGNDPLHQKVRGRLDTETYMRPTPPPNSIASAVGLSPDSYSDVVRTMIPAMGDYRILAALQNVPASLWQPHPLAFNTDVRSAHNFSSFGGSTETGYKIAKDPANPLPNVLLPDGITSVPTYNTADPSKRYQLVAGAAYTDARQADLPNDLTACQIANSYGDFDTGIANAREGPYINKADEGNFYAASTLRNGITKFYRSGYFYNSWQQSDDWNTGIFMTPNRMISSPVMFGSLPTAIWPGSMSGSGAPTLDSATNYQPWQTLLFRPYTQNVALGNAGKPNHPGEANPQDHYLLDMFFMPVVEPYAISEPLSEAGKINMNFQIMPFSYIRRATGMQAVLKGELMTAIPMLDVNNAKAVRAATWTSSRSDEFWDESAVGGRKYWHRPIDAVETLKQFDERFNFATGVAPKQQGLFRSASQICETYMMPKTAIGPGDPVGSFGVLTALTRKNAMKTFWQNHAVTGENVRERPYSNIYSRVTTRSNTFNVHVRAQVIKKARSTDPDTFDPVKDAVLSEYRGSTVLERFIDPNDSTKPIPDYAASPNPLSLAPLDTFYQFRTLETKRFAP